jgi:exopolysaccharide production protein ExoZ
MIQQKVQGIQILRGVAASGVVYLHAVVISHEHGNGLVSKDVAQLGAAGVDLFFVISGLIMVLISGPLPHSRSYSILFLKRRFFRVVPIYWLLTIFKVMIALFIPSLFFGYHASLIHSVGSFFFLPVRDNGGDLYPVVKVGWTLVYEMFFYCVFAASLFLVPRKAYWATIGLVTILAISGVVIDTKNDFLWTYTNPLLLEFAFGCLIGVFAARLQMNPGLALLLIILAALALAIGTVHPITELRPLKCGLPCVALVIAFLSLERYFALTLFRPLVILGNASYSLYLTHQFTQGGATLVWTRIARVMSMAPLYSDVGMVVMLMAFSLVVGLIFYYLVEDWIAKSFSATSILPPVISLGSFRHLRGFRARYGGLHSGSNCTAATNNLFVPTVIDRP